MTDAAEGDASTDDADAIFWHLAARRRPGLLKQAFGPLGAWLPPLVAPAPVLEAGGEFQLFPDPQAAPAKAMRWIFAVREGYCGPAWSALFGDVVDLVAVDRTLQRPVSRLIGVAPVLGSPQDASAADAPVRVFATVWGWLAGGFDGVVLIGDRMQQQHWLRACAAGIVADDVGHAEALQLKMWRVVPELPKLYVAGG